MAEKTTNETRGIEGVAETVARFRERFLEKIAAGSFELPMLPEIASRVMSATDDAHCDARKLSALIHQDASLAGHVLRISNSALYGGSVPIVSLQQAVSRLGMKKIREVSLLIACQTKVFRVPGHDEEIRRLFRHSIAAALFAQEIARLRRWNVEEAFLSGLLHDAGKPALLQLLIDVQKELSLGVEPSLVEDILDDMHASVASRMIEQWKLPERLAETISCHHRPQEARTAGQAAMMTHFADDLAHFALATRPVLEPQIRQHAMLVPLNVYSDELEGLLKRCPAIKSAAESLL